MLVLTRKEKQSIIINDDIVVTVVSIGGDNVQLSIEAPKHVPVHRHEIYEAIKHDHRPPGPNPPANSR